VGTDLDAVVVGAGVIGLTTAICAAEAGLAVEVWTADPPERTTSAVAGALLGPAVGPPDDPVTRWTLAGDRVFRTLADDPSTGVRVARGRLVSNLGDTPPPWAADLPGYAPLGVHERAGFGLGFWVDLPVADMRAYLPYLRHRLSGAGGRLVERRVSRLEDGFAAAPTVVDCTGVAARGLAGDDGVRAVKGQHVVVANPGIDTFFYEGGAPGDTWTGYFPHGDRVVLGGYAGAGDWSLEPDPAVSAGIVARCAAVEPALGTAEVLAVEVGLRPERNPPRLAVETVDGGRIVHSYGHGSVGVTVSWGCARDALALIRPG
jgi:D-amino-acid oxidase